MSIKTRIGIALGVVLLLHIFTAVMGHVGLEKSQRDFVAYDEINADTIMVLSIDRRIEQLQRHVTSHMLSGHESVADRARELREEVEESILAAQQKTTNTDVAERLSSMLDRIRSYGNDFEKASEDRAARYRLIREEMIPTHERLITILEGAAAKHPELLPAVRTTIDQFLRGETAALQYYEAPDRIKVDKALLHLQAAASTAQQLDAELIGADIPKMLEKYREAFFTSVNATRGYFHLVNVVLAGEAAELLNNSAEIRSLSLVRRDAIGNSLRADSKRFQVISDTIAVLTVLCGLVMASLITRSVVSPILRMTETFRQLSRGESGTAIDSVNRSDEFGAMSKAAEVFRLKNIQTEHLLDESQRMGLDLEQRNNEMTQFVYTVSHDLKSPLVTILGYAGMLQKNVEQGKHDELPEMTERISKAGHRMVQTLEDLLNLSKIGVLVNDPKVIDIRTVCGMIVADLHTEISSADAEIVIDDNLAPVLADELRIRQVLQNLIHNALKHGHPDSGSPRIHVRCQAQPSSVLLSVQDNGPGIEQVYKEKIFQIFQRLDAGSSGTGVGLAIVKKVAEAHDGRAWVESTPGQGATFFVELPTKSPSTRAA